MNKVNNMSDERKAFEKWKASSTQDEKTLWEAFAFGWTMGQSRKNAEIAFAAKLEGKEMRKEFEKFKDSGADMDMFMNEYGDETPILIMWIGFKAALAMVRKEMVG